MINFSMSSMRSTCTPFVHGSSDHLSRTAPAGMDSCSCTESPFGFAQYIRCSGRPFRLLKNERIWHAVLVVSKHNESKGNLLGPVNVPDISVARSCFMVCGGDGPASRSGGRNLAAARG